MGLKDIFKKKKEGEKTEIPGEGKKEVDYSSALDQVDTANLSFKEKMGLKMFKRMSKKKQEDMRLTTPQLSFFLNHIQ